MARRRIVGGIRYGNGTCILNDDHTCSRMPHVLHVYLHVHVHVHATLLFTRHH